MPDRETAEKEMFPSFKLTFSTETHSSTFPPSPCFLVAGDSTKGPVLPSLSAPFTAHTHTLCVWVAVQFVRTYILTRLNPHYEPEMNNSIEIAAMFTLAQH